MIVFCEVFCCFYFVVLLLPWKYVWYCTLQSNVCSVLHQCNSILFCFMPPTLCLNITKPNRYNTRLLLLIFFVVPLPWILFLSYRLGPLMFRLYECTERSCICAVIVVSAVAPHSCGYHEQQINSWKKRNKTHTTSVRLSKGNKHTNMWKKKQQSPYAFLQLRKYGHCENE